MKDHVRNWTNDIVTFSHDFKHEIHYFYLSTIFFSVQWDKKNGKKPPKVGGRSFSRKDVEGFFLSLDAIVFFSKSFLLASYSLLFLSIDFSSLSLPCFMLCLCRTFCLKPLIAVHVCFLMLTLFYKHFFSPVFASLSPLQSVNSS